MIDPLRPDTFAAASPPDLRAHRTAGPRQAWQRLSATWLVTRSFPLVAVIGCANNTSTFEIVDYRDRGEVRRYRETFDEAYYHLDKQSSLEIVLRRATPSQPNPGQTITQIIHIRSVWRCIPGTTIAHRTQINGTVSYHIVTGEVGATFEGAGSVFFTQDEKKGTLRGSLDLATLKPTREHGAAHDLFRRAELRGKFHAKRDPRCVTRIINEMDRLFGQAPPSNGK